MLLLFKATFHHLTVPAAGGSNTPPSVERECENS